MTRNGTNLKRSKLFFARLSTSFSIKLENKGVNRSLTKLRLKMLRGGTVGLHTVQRLLWINVTMLDAKAAAGREYWLAALSKRYSRKMKASRKKKNKEIKQASQQRRRRIGAICRPTVQMRALENWPGRKRRSNDVHGCFCSFLDSSP